ncbi:MAG: glycosyltransferase family 1 protein [Burkholderiales bacterium]|nr:glycosyltransferase family 1 protein [Burkholderiales bacterium]
MGQPLRLLVATWDGAGNLPPILALVNRLVHRGHAVHVLAHDVQKDRIEAAGGTFLGFDTTAQIDHGRSQPLGANPLASLLELDRDATNDLLAACDRLGPDALLVDCMLPGTLSAAKRTGRPTVALVHALYGAFIGFAGGAFRGPIDESDLALGFTYSALDDAASARPNLVFVGPARPPAPATHWARRRPERPLVMASLSTGLQGKPGTQLALLQRVCDGLATLDIEALITTGRGIAPEELIAGPSTTLHRFVPHEVVLAQANLLITHAGHGSVTAALAAGVPMLCMPPGGDQPFNAARVAQLGLGVTLDPAAPSDHIGEAVTRLLADEDLRRRSQAFATLVSRHPGLDLAVERVETLRS